MQKLILTWFTRKMIMTYEFFMKIRSNIANDWFLWLGQENVLIPADSTPKQHHVINSNL